jgi:hypothetical protein
MNKNQFAGQTLGLFFAPNRAEQMEILAQALRNHGAEIQTIKDEKEIGVVIAAAGPLPRMRAIISDSSIIHVLTADALMAAKIDLVCVNLEGKGPRIIPCENRILGDFVQNSLRPAEV